MSPTVDAFLRSWSFDPCLVVALLVMGVIYLRGWLVLHRPLPFPPAGEGRVRRRWQYGYLAAFFGGLAAIYLALASPIEPFAALLLQVHMVQHVLLMMVAPPLLWLGAPLFPLLRGLPRPVRVYWVAPLMSSAPLRRLFGRLTHPLTALPLFIATTWLWHIPPVYDMALRSSCWHYLQHICFLSTALIFWYPVIRPYPSRPHWSSWLLLVYLIIADLSNTILSALLTFSDRVLYPYYAEVPRLAGLSPLDDQSAAGVIMWVPGSVAFLLPLFGIAIRLLSNAGLDRGSGREGNGLSHVALTHRVTLPVISVAHLVPPSPGHPVPSSRFDLLRVPVLGRFLKSRHARLAMQLPLLLLAGLVIYDGLRGPQVGAMNLAGVLPWIHWRGLIVLGLLAAGNVFCMGCPFLLPRSLARRWLPQGWSWPRRLRGKWPAVLLIVALLWAYEALALWDRPWWTACLALGYFVAAFVIDGLFRGASFCKYLCPIGQFNFVQSLASPVEVRARDPAVCTSCRTKDCIRGRPPHPALSPSGGEGGARGGIPGCELQLFLPRKAGNMDCTVCLDCVHACPHDNVGLIVGPPGAALWDDRQRSGIGRFGRRLDIAALVIVLVFGAFANAAGMVGPVVEGQKWFMGWTGVRSPLLATTAFYLLALVVVPVLAVGATAALSRRWGRLQDGILAVATRFTYTLVPLGFGMWLAHYCFHFLTSYAAAVPVAQRFVVDLGLMSFPEPEWSQSCCRPETAWLLPLELLFLDVGLLLSLYTGYRLVPTLKVLAPWALLMVLLFAAGVWILFQPMEMRGTF